MKKAIFVLSASIFIFSGFTDAFAQCGATGLEPCITKIVKPAAKTVIKKANTVKKAVASEVNKKPQTKSAQKKTKTNKNNKNNKSIFESLALEPEKTKPADDGIFPINGVIIGKTTETQMQILGGKRNVFTDDSTGAQRVYYTINNTNFWMRDGVADSIGIYKFIDRFPTKWELLGFNFQLSYKESIKLLEGMGYTVQSSVSLPKLEEIGKKNTTARITATKDTEVPVMIVMSFLFDGGKKLDSPETLLYMFAGVKR